MKYFLCIFAATILFGSSLLADEPAGQSGISFPKTDWPFWRGPGSNGHADPAQQPPVSWSDSENVLWKTPVPGRGHGSPIVVGTRVFLTVADEARKVHSVVAFDRASGKQVWESVVHRDGFKFKGRLNKKASLASSTPACDGTRLFVNFLNGKDATTSAIDFNGKVLWQTKLSGYVVHQGYGSSPVIYKDLVIAAADNKSGGAIVAMNRESGKIVWKKNRPKNPNYPTPIVINAAGRDQLVLTGCGLVTSLEPATGKVIWEMKGATTECVTTTVSDGNIVLSSGGYPRNHMAAYRVDGSKEVVWENSNRMYVPSVVISNGHIFGVLDAGIAICIRCSDGKEMWKQRLGGTFSSSAVLVGEMVYVTSEDGTTHVFRANPKKFVSVAKSKLGDEVFATPAIVGGRCYNRVAHRDGDKRQEYLYCLAK